MKRDFSEYINKKDDKDKETLGQILIAAAAVVFVDLLLLFMIHMCCCGKKGTKYYRKVRERRNRSRYFSDDDSSTFLDTSATTITIMCTINRKNKKQLPQELRYKQDINKKRTKHHQEHYEEKVS